MANNRICFVAGKSGGHIIPCLAIAQQYVDKNNSTKVLFFSADTDLDMQILYKQPLVSDHVPLSLSTVNSTTWLGYFSIVRNLFGSFLASIKALRQHRPWTIITTGGVTALPVCIAGYLLGIPIIVHCLDAMPGKAIRAISPLATSIVTPFAAAQNHFKVSTLAPFPLRYTNTDKSINGLDVYQQLNFDPAKKTILVLGGSQGSQFINSCMEQIIAKKLVPLETIQIVHQVGKVDSRDWDSFYQSHKVSAYPFSYQQSLSALYTIADLIICRAGAGTLFEALFFNKKSLVIPLITQTTDHQVTNAHAIAEQHPDLFAVIAQETIEDDICNLADKIKTLLAL